MACKCMINGGTVTPTACLSWPKILKIVCLGQNFSATTFKWSPRSLLTRHCVII